ncbi:MAG: YdeI/OmpD-associated family protein [Flavobacteriia bacterium]|nr:YdeI/OmpD-associated family protein [Flavobacteriia bacterium]MBH2024684.1 YdeI/OmpD-associated family protein [Flavobacteriales bacterium]
MSTTDPRIDAYIENVQPFAKPILTYLREIIHETCPDAEEGWKWSFPHFMYKGKILCAFTAFKQHCGFGFWLEKEMKTITELSKDAERTGMFTLGKIRSIEDLPSKALLKAAIKEAMDLTDMGVTLKKAAPEKKETEVPAYFSEALNQNVEAKKVFENGSSSFRKEYIMWITEAKTEATRNKRMAEALEWLSEGKGRNWKYEKR